MTLTGTFPVFILLFFCPGGLVQVGLSFHLALRRLHEVLAHVRRDLGLISCALAIFKVDRARPLTNYVRRFTNDDTVIGRLVRRRQSRRFTFRVLRVLQITRRTLRGLYAMDGMVKDGTPRIRTSQDHLKDNDPFAIVVSMLRLTIRALGLNALCCEDRRIIYVHSTRAAKCNATFTRYVASTRTCRKVCVFKAFKGNYGGFTRCLRKVAAMRVITISGDGQFLCCVNARRCDVINSPEFNATFKTNRTFKGIVSKLRCRFTKSVTFMFKGGLITRVLLGVFAGCRGRLSGANVSNVMGEVVRSDFTVQT